MQSWPKKFQSLKYAPDLSPHSHHSCTGDAELYDVTQKYLCHSHSHWHPYLGTYMGSAL